MRPPHLESSFLAHASVSGSKQEMDIRGVPSVVTDYGDVRNVATRSIGLIQVAMNGQDGETTNSRNYAQEFLDSIPAALKRFYEQLPVSAQNAMRIAAGYWSPNDAKPQDQVIFGTYLIALVGMGDNAEKLIEGAQMSKAFNTNAAAVVAAIQHTEEDVYIADITFTNEDVALLQTDATGSNLANMTAAEQERRAQRIEKWFGISIGTDQEAKYQEMIASSDTILADSALSAQDQSAALSGLLLANSKANRELGLIASAGTTTDLQQSWKDFLGDTWEEELTMNHAEARAMYQQIMQTLNEELRNATSVVQRFSLRAERAVVLAVYYASEFRYFIHARSGMDMLTTSATSFGFAKTLRDRIFERLIQLGIPSRND